MSEILQRLRSFAIEIEYHPYRSVLYPGEKMCLLREAAAEIKRLTNLETAFRELRQQWFATQLCEEAHEREREPAERTKIREKGNEERRALFDADTDAIIAGEQRQVCPYCIADFGPISGETNP